MDNYGDGDDLILILPLLVLFNEDDIVDFWSSSVVKEATAGK